MTEIEQQERRQVLVIDDSKVVRWQASKVLDQEYMVHMAEDGAQAWEILQQNEQIALAFCDLQMPNMGGYELLEKVRNSDDPRLVNLPIVILTGDADDQYVKQRCLEAGATDFIPKPFDEVILKGRAAAYTGYQRRVAELETQVDHDPLTGLASVQFFRRYGEQAVAMGQRHKTDLTLVLVELDGEQALLQRIGKKVFAQVLARVAKQISALVRIEDLSARVGMARFAVMLPLTNRVGALRAAERLHQGIHSLRLKVAGEVLSFGVSIGVVSLLEDSEANFIDLVHDAEAALKQVQQQGGDAVRYFESAPAARQQAVAPGEPIPAAVLEWMKGLEGDVLEPEQLRSVLQQVWPLLVQGNEHLGLGLDLPPARQRLDTPLA